MLLGTPLELRAGAEDKLPSTFSGTAYSGGFVPDYGVVIDMASTTYNRRLPLLSEHWRGNIIGVIEQASTVDHQMQVAGKLFSDMEGSRAQEIAQLAKRGVPFEMSVGLYNFTSEYVPEGKSVTVNGKSFTGPVRVLRNGQVREVSIVTLGADPRTESKFFTASEGEPPMPTPNTEELQAQVAQLSAQVQGHAAALAAARAEGAEAERKRIAEVRAQAMPGHEALIEELAADGKTTGPEAAVKVLAAEKARVAAAGEQRRSDGQQPIKQSAAEQDKRSAPAGGQRRAPAGFELNSDAAALDAEARAYQAAHPGTDYVAAVKAVQNLQGV